MKHKYLVKIDDSVLPQSFTFDQLIDNGLLDNFDEKIKIKLEKDTVWIVAREFPFSELENSQVESLNSEVKEKVKPQTTHIKVPPGKKNPPKGFVQDSLNKEIKQTVEVKKEVPVEFPLILKKWNWGAFTLSWLWALCNGVYWPLIIIFINFIPFVGAVISLGICFFLGFRGNNIAWNVAKQKNTSIEQFASNQRIWNVIGLVSFIAILILIPVYVLM